MLQGSFLRILGLCLLPALAGQAIAQDYPSRPVKIVMPLAPGGGADAIVRILAQDLTEQFKQSFVVENKPGANGNIGVSSVARSTPDGYTLLMAYSGFQVTNPSVYRNPGWDPIKDFVPVALVGRAPQVLVGKKGLPFGDLNGLVAYARSNPDSLNFASTGIGSLSHIGSAQFMQALNIKVAHVPYRGAGPAMNDLIGGMVDLTIVTPTSAMGNLAAGNIKALGLMADRRHPMLPDVRTVAEQGLPPIDLTTWFAIYAPAGTPGQIVEALASRIRTAVSSPAYKTKLNEQGAYADFLGSRELGELTAKDLAYWKPIIDGAGIKID